MKNVLVTGAHGFIARNLIAALDRRKEDDAVEVSTFTSRDSADQLAERLKAADIVFHLAGANRPDNPDDFQLVNAGLTGRILDIMESLDAPPAIVLASSTQAELDNPYGRSKRAAEKLIEEYHQRTGAPATWYRLPNVFGKWSRPNYNTVVATFCHKIGRGEPIQINDPSHKMTLVYVDEVVRCFLRHLDITSSPGIQETVEETFQITVGDLAERLNNIYDIRKTLTIPDISDPLTRYLYSTYLSFLSKDDFAYDALMRTDDRGWLFELVKSNTFGQIFVSTTRPGITRGNHYHDTKIEKFCLIQGNGLIRFRLLENNDVIEYPVDDQRIRIVDIPPGYTHSIENTGDQNMIVLFWANEIFDINRPDTYWIPVIE